jgi:hypothetical protein
VAPAASYTVSSTLTSAFTQAAAAQGQKLTVQQVHTLPTGDPRVWVPFYTAIALVVGGYLASPMVMTVSGVATRRGRAGVLLGFSVIAGLLVDTLVGPILGGFSSHFLVLWPLLSFIVFAVAVGTAALQSVLGVAGTCW